MEMINAPGAMDNTMGFSYFGARYYDSDLSVWLSVDPMSDKRSWISPYNYCQWNPVGRVDPTGALDWEPVVSNGRIYLKAEKGDNAETLKQFFGGSENAKKYIDESHLNNDKQYQGGELIKFKGTDKFSRAIQHARENPDKYVDGYNPETIMPDDDTPDDWSAGYSSLKPNYNCFSFARQTQTQDTWNFTTGESPPIDLKKEGYTPTAPSNVVFGQTIVFFGGLDKNTMTHAGVFFGVNSNKSMAYLFHKPDAHHVPILTPVSLNTLNVPRYGIVKGLYTK
ncbi:MAG: RHS repeat-associated core domain-containing protein [Bacteroidales bacterium]